MGRSLIVISGLPGVGKSAVAASVAVRTGGVHFSVDPIEDAMVACGLPSGWTVGVVAYEAVRAMAELNLALGHCVMVDAVNDSEEARQTWRTAATSQSATLFFVHLTCSDEIEHQRRLASRRRGFTSLPEPSWSMVRDRAQAYAPWTDDHLAVDTVNTSVEEVSVRVCAYASGENRKAVEST